MNIRNFIQKRNQFPDLSLFVLLLALWPNFQYRVLEAHWNVKKRKKVFKITISILNITCINKFFPCNCRGWETNSCTIHPHCISENYWCVFWFYCPLWGNCLQKKDNNTAVMTIYCSSFKLLHSNQRCTSDTL